MSPAPKRGAGPKVEIAVMIRAASWREGLPNAARLARRAARAALAAAASRTRWGKRLAARGGEIGIVLASDAFVARLNRDFRGKAGPTNVLSFAVLPEDVASEGPAPLGDVVIAYATAKSEARAAAKPLAHHFLHLVVHGVLHLLGYDHERDKDAARMERLEAEILRGLGVPDPYRAVKTAKVA